MFTPFVCRISYSRTRSKSINTQAEQPSARSPEHDHDSRAWSVRLCRLAFWFAAVCYDTGVSIMHILVVEDEKKVASFIKRGLEAANYSVDVEHDGETGLSRLLKTDYDLVILDVMLPRVDGLSLMKEIRQRRIEVPVLLLTARVTIADRVMGLDLRGG